MTAPAECVILDIPQGLRLDLLGLIVEVGQVRIVADRAGLLGGLLASLTCGGVGAAETLEQMAQLIRGTQQAQGGAAGSPQAQSA